MLADEVRLVVPAGSNDSITLTAMEKMSLVKSVVSPPWRRCRW
jgi:hypothetical protein